MNFKTMHYLILTLYFTLIMLGLNSKENYRIKNELIVKALIVSLF